MQTLTPELKLKFVYGPVSSWRLGKSLGIDPISRPEKTCNMDCVYCQLGKTKKLSNERCYYVPTNEILYEACLVPDTDIDHITFSGRGEPTLARNLGDMIRGLRSLRGEKIAVITNSTLIHLPDVQKDLSLCDVVLAKCDVPDHSSFSKINKVHSGIYFKQVVDGLTSFRRKFRGKLAVQVMFVKHNKDRARDIANILRVIRPDEVHLNTPLRPSGILPLSENELKDVELHFEGLDVLNVYEEERKFVEPINIPETIKRHGNYKKELVPAVRRS